MAPHIIPATGDPGLQPERTALSWNRTAFAIAVNALLSLRMGLVSSEPWLVAIGALLLAAAGAVVVIAVVRRRQLSGAHLVITAPRAAFIGVAVTTFVASVGGIASVFVGGSFA